MDPFVSEPAPFPKQQPQPSCNSTYNDVDVLNRQACMFSASGELVCNKKKILGNDAIVREECAKPPSGYKL